MYSATSTASGHTDIRHASLYVHVFVYVLLQLYLFVYIYICTYVYIAFIYNEMCADLVCVCVCVRVCVHARVWRGGGVDRLELQWYPHLAKPPHEALRQDGAGEHHHYHYRHCHY